MKAETLKKLAVVALVTMVAACNTVQGAGKDVQSIGKAGERTLDKAKQGM
jgi:predicted small secreted protein